MPSRNEVNYFGAGPAPLPTPVLEEAARNLLNYKNTGVGLAEISHRSSDANLILAETKSALSTLLDIPEDYEILFLQSGGSGEFSAVVYHMVALWVERRRKEVEEELKGQMQNGDGGQGLSDAVFERLEKAVKSEMKLDYLVTGSWSLKASQEAARLVGSEYVNVAVDAREHGGQKFGKVPEESSWKLTEGRGCAMTYFCDNETVDGVEFASFPKSLAGDEGRLIVADMSSNFISRKVDVRKYAVIFGGAQKNVGTTGITIVIVRKNILGQLAAPTLLRRLHLPVGPVVLDWPTIAKNNSLYNTLPIFDVWIAGQVMKNLVEAYGAKAVGGQEEVSNKKAELLYSTLDRYPQVYKVVPSIGSRSRMNICFRVHGGDADKEKAFLAGAEKKMLLGLKGHRSVGGIRASNCRFPFMPPQPCSIHLPSLTCTFRQRRLGRGRREACEVS